MRVAFLLLCVATIANAQDDDSSLVESLQQYVDKVFGAESTTKLFEQPSLVLFMISTGVACLLGACCCLICCLCAIRKDHGQMTTIDFDLEACEVEKPQKRLSQGEDTYDTDAHSYPDVIDDDHSPADRAEAELHTYITDLITEPATLGGSSRDDVDPISLYGMSMKSIGEHSVDQEQGGLSKDFSARFGNQYNDDSSRFSYRGSTRTMNGVSSRSITLASARKLGGASTRKTNAGPASRGMASKKFSYRKEDSFFNMLAGLKEEPREDDSITDSGSVNSATVKSQASANALPDPPTQPQITSPVQHPGFQQAEIPGVRRNSFIRINL